MSTRFSNRRSSTRSRAWTRFQPPGVIGARLQEEDQGERPPGRSPLRARGPQRVWGVLSKWVALNGLAPFGGLLPIWSGLPNWGQLRT
jgi:hypothetical protein